VVSYSDIILGDIWAFNPKDNSWHRAAPTGEQILPREGHSAVTIAKTEMWVFGGISYGHIPFNDLWMYDSAKDQWSVQKPLGTLPPPRWLHTADVWVDSNNVPRMYIFGGVTKNFIPLDDLWYLDRIENKWHHPKSVGAPPFPPCSTQATSSRISYSCTEAWLTTSRSKISSLSISATESGRSNSLQGPTPMREKVTRLVRCSLTLHPSKRFLRRTGSRSSPIPIQRIRRICSPFCISSSPAHSTDTGNTTGTVGGSSCSEARVLRRKRVINGAFRSSCFFRHVFFVFIT